MTAELPSGQPPRLSGNDGEERAMTTTPTLWKDLEQVNSGDQGPTGDGQTDPVVVGLANGNILVAYTDTSDSVGNAAGSDIIGRIFDPNGVPLGPSYRLNVLSTFKEESNPEIAALSDGGFVMVYETNDDDSSKISYERYDALGGPIHGRTIALGSEADGVEVGYPRVAVFDDDSAVVTFTIRTDGAADVGAVVVSADGTTTPAFPVRIDGDDPRSADLDVLSDGVFVTAFIENDNDASNIEIAGVTTVGEILFAKNVASPGINNESPRVVTLSEDRFVVVWADDNENDPQIYGQIFNHQGNSVSGLLEIATDIDSDFDPSVARLDDGGFVVVYEQSQPEQKIIGQRYDQNGETVGEEIVLADPGGTTDLADPEVSLLADGRFVVTWTRTDGDADIVAQIWDPRGDSIVGTDEDDAIAGLQAPSTVDGLDGQDRLFGVSGNDWLYGSSGHDSLYGDRGFDWLYGGEGHDLLVGGSGKDRHFGGSGSDTMVIEPNFALAKETYDGGSGFDRLVLRPGASLPSDVEITAIEALEVHTGSGDDSLRGSDFLYDLLFGGSGNDDLRGGTGVDFLTGGFHVDTLRGNDDNDVLIGGKARDSLFGNDGDDEAYGGADSDRIVGGSGGDRLYGDAGRDSLNGNSGADILFGGSGNDTLVVDTLTDVVFEGAGEGAADLIRSEIPDYTLADDLEVERATLAKNLGEGSLTGNTINNSLTGNTGDNFLRGEDGDDLLRGQDGNDLLFGDFGNDTIKGGGGDDIIAGGNVISLIGDGPDTLMGQKGADTISLVNADSAFGGRGDDEFHFDGDESGNPAGGGPSVIGDFHGELLTGGAERDLLVFAAGLERGSFAYRGDSAFSGGGNSEARHAGSGLIEVDHDGDGSGDIKVTVLGVSQGGDLTAQDFLWL